MTQQQILVRLQAMKRQGVGITNMGAAVDVIIDAVAYLVQNTPEVKK